ncbi:hypothetical protein FOQG_17115 [Fusarium oxysporum f. sp. raphani 54005]|uniref:Uncharacterized protein n=1 Tax=Fusarium oxysporum f. sp. raphani 54005 TaxID=1089458 RepID=X0B8X7_FUSOX|nr:hypothetical protein FOQG_17115 [Fusarium oxysporum f. sp. raphani 54005]EXL38950.1 hypothetical protein FOCG_18422 [Fusarium oxysporum f. sp. radicis-lycopersici 26381]
MCIYRLEVQRHHASVLITVPAEKVHEATYGWLA